MITQLLLYSLKSALTLSLLYLPYTLMLQKEKFFRTNRMVLLCIIVLSLVLPMCNVSWMSLDNTPIMQAAHQQMIDVGIPIHMADGDITVSYVLEEGSSSLSWFTVLAIVFFVGMAASVVVRCLQLGILSYMMRYRNLWTKRLEDGTRVCCRKGKFTPYSWMHTIVISEDDWNDGQREILLHESGHIRALHSWDMLLLMLCQAIQWYNPLVWLMSSSLSDVHEYEADDYVLRQGVDLHGYMMLLVKKVAQSQGYSFVNGLNKSTLNKRILMMKEKVRGNRWMRAKLLYLLPVCALVLCAFATPKLTAPVQEVLTNLEEGAIQKVDTCASNVMPEVETANKVIEGNELTGNEPLVVIDGKIVNGLDLSEIMESEEAGIENLERLNPNQITSVTVLRGASATSVWGEQGKNGAIMITTIHGEAKKNDTQTDSLLQGIVDRIPGAEIGDDGTVYLNGKKVSKLLVNDKEHINDETESDESTPEMTEDD